MVPADSRRIPRAPRYSGYRYASCRFAYRTVTVYGATFQRLPLTTCLAMSRSYNPAEAGTSAVWADPRSLATTGGITVCFLFLRVLRCFSSPGSPPHVMRMTRLQRAGLSHSEIRGSKAICAYPRLIAAYRVLHRLREPRHPPCALSYFPRQRGTKAARSYFQMHPRVPQGHRDAGKTYVSFLLQSCLYNMSKIECGSHQE